MAADTMRYLPSELGQEAAGAVYDIATGAKDSERWSPPGTWTELAAGGWTEMADGPRPGADGELSLFDLCVVAESWGRALVGLPLLTTWAARRWLAERPAADVRLTFCVPEFGAYLLPYPAGPGRGAVAGAGGTAEVPAVSADSYAPSLPLGHLEAEPLAASAPMLRDYAVLALSEAVGAADRALISAVDYARTRHQFGRPIGSFQAIKHTLANMHCDVELARSGVVWFCNDLGAMDASADTVLRMCSSVVERAVQVFGGIGYTWECDLHWSLRHVAQAHRVVMAALEGSLGAVPEVAG